MNHFKRWHILFAMSIVILAVLTPMAAAQEEAVVQEAVVGWIANAALGIEAGEIDGTSAVLTRLESGVHVEVHTSGLEPGHAFTMWWVVFNEPANCTDLECGGDDVLILDDNGDPALDENGGLIFNIDQIESVNISFLRADGHTIDESGAAMFRSRLPEGNAFEAAVGGGLVDAMQAEIHIVLRSHGAAIPGMMDAQIYELDGGCNPECVDLQDAVFNPPAAD